jgi:hypothetical protein
VLLHRLVSNDFSIFFSVISRSELLNLEILKIHWQASQPTSSMTVNFTSVAGTAENCDAAAALAADIPAAEPEDTAFIWLFETVDFSACVALMVRR